METGKREARLSETILQVLQKLKTQGEKLHLKLRERNYTENSGREITLKTQGEKAKERKDRRQSVLASGLKGGPAAVREVVIMKRRRVIRVIMLMMVRMMMMMQLVNFLEYFY